MRLAGTCNKYSSSAIPQLTKAATYQGAANVPQVAVPRKRHEKITGHEQQDGLQGQGNGLNDVHEMYYPSPMKKGTLQP